MNKELLNSFQRLVPLETRKVINTMYNENDKKSIKLNKKQTEKTLENMKSFLGLINRMSQDRKAIAMNGLYLALIGRSTKKLICITCEIDIKRNAKHDFEHEIIGTNWLSLYATFCENKLFSSFLNELQKP